MTTIRVPANLHAALAGPLAVRGLRVTSDPAVAAAVAVGSVPAGAPRWLALVTDQTAAVAALDRGADDVATLQCAPALVAARVARLVRPRLLRAGALAIDPLARTAARAGRPLNLLPREYAVLHALALRAHVTVSRTELREAVWGRDFDPGTNVIEVQVSRVRAALDRGAPPMLLTERGRGYRLVSEPAIASTAAAS